jgi:hypothetical protein
MQKPTENEISAAVGRVVARSTDPQASAHSYVIEQGVREGWDGATKKFNWTPEHPTEPGLYAVAEQFGDEPPRTGVYTVEYTNDDTQLIYGGIRLVSDAPAGTLFHRLSPLPA